MTVEPLSGPVLVAGLGVSGAAAARVLLDRGVRVLLADGARPAAVDELTAAGAEWLGGIEVVPDGVALVVTSPGWRPDAPLLADAAARGIPVVGEPQLAWDLREPGQDGVPAPWLAVTGTNGKTTTVTMLEAVLLADGRRAVQLPAALVLDAGPGGRRGAQRGRRPHRLARLVRRLPRRQVANPGARTG